MKIREIQGARYKVDASIISTHAIANFVNVGWDLPKIFDQMSDSLKKRITHRVTQKQKGLRYRVRPAP